MLVQLIQKEAKIKTKSQSLYDRNPSTAGESKFEGGKSYDKMTDEKKAATSAPLTGTEQDVLLKLLSA